ncbi:MAG: hypothetical protein RIT40_747 [Planctomycetota bacterium]|jgi:RNA polymerase sigma-54 factor
MVLEPRQLQGLEVLAAPPDELYEYLLHKAETNATLVVRPPQRVARQASADHAEWLANLEDRSSTVRADARAQLALRQLPELDARWVSCLLDALDERGFLSCSDEELLQLAHSSGLERDYAQLGRAIAVVQSLEPRGLGARDAREALLLQLDPTRGSYELLARLIEDFLDDLGAHKHARVAKELGIDLSLLNELLEDLGQLELTPAALDASVAAPVTPELEVEPKLDGGFELRLCDGALPSVEVEPGLARLAELRRDDAQVRKFLGAQLKETRDLAAALESRRRTLLAVAREVFVRQHAFLRHGLNHLAPLSMGEVAETLGVALSTVSRAVAGKYVQTPFGILPLRRFFQVAAGGDTTRARESLGEALAALIKAEDPRQPLSDDELVARLAARGFQAARRTIARWREELGIPTSYRRRSAS